MKKIAIIGSGVVGQATGLGFLHKGHEVIFHDVQSAIIDKLTAQGYKVRHINDLDVHDSEVFFFVVPTPTEKGKINLTYIKNAAKSLGKKLKKRTDYFVVVVRSTVVPKTTEDVIVPIIERESGKKAGKDFGVAMNPEYLREANAVDDFKNPWIVTVGTLDERTKSFIYEIYANSPCPVHYVSIKEAEMQKYVHNLYNAVKIAFFNEMRVVGKHIDVDTDVIFGITAESAEAFWNKKYGLRDLGPFSGTCLPKDTQAFLKWAQDQNIHMDVLNGTIVSNKRFGELWHENKTKKKMITKNMTHNITL